MKKRLISFLLTLVMLVSLCSVFTVSASADAQVATVTIGSGDTVLGICQKYGIDYYTYKNLIMTLNGMTDESQFRKLAVGAKVVLPVSNTAAAALAGGTATVSGTGNNTAGTATGSGLTTGTVSNLPAGDHVAYYLVTYTVQKGETIGGIYSNMGLSYKTYQNQIVKLNNLRNINAVQAGQTLVLPVVSPGIAGATYTTIMAHTMRSGESAYNIIIGSYGLDYNSNLAKLQALNNRSDMGLFRVGETLYIPVAGVVTANTTVSGGTTGGSTTTGTVSNSGYYNLVSQNATNGNFDLQVNGKSVKTASAGQLVSVVCTPDTGYAVESVKVVKVGDAATAVTVTNNSFVMPSYSVTVSVTFKQAVQSAITVDAASNGGVAAMVNNVRVDKAYAGTQVVIKTTPATGFMLDNVRVTYNDYRDTIAVEDGKFTMPNFPVTVTASFKVDPNYKPSMGSNIYTDVSNAKITAKVGSTVVTSAKAGETVTLEVTPDTNYTVESVKVYYADFTKTAELDKMSFIMPNEPVTVVAVVKPTAQATFAIKKVDNTEGTFKTTVDGKEVESAKVGQTVKIEGSSSKAFYNYIPYITMTGNSSVTVPFDEDKMTFTMPDFPVTISVKFYIYHNVVLDASNGSNGWFNVTAVINGQQVSRCGAGVELKVNVAGVTKGMSAGNIIVTYADGSSYTLDGNTFIMPDCDVRVRVNFTKNAKLVVYSARNLIDGTETVKANRGNSYTIFGNTVNDKENKSWDVYTGIGNNVVIVPNPTVGYKLSYIRYQYTDSKGNVQTGNVAKHPVTGKYQFQMPNADSVELFVVFEEIASYKITVDYGTANKSHTMGTAELMTTLGYTDKAAAGAKIWVRLFPAQGYKLDVSKLRIVTASGTELKYNPFESCFTMPAEDVTVYLYSTDAAGEEQNCFVDTKHTITLLPADPGDDGLPMGNLTASINDIVYSNEQLQTANDGAAMKFDEGTIVTIISESREGYALDKTEPIIVTKDGGTTVPVTIISETRFSFRMPLGNVKVEASYGAATYGINKVESANGSYTVPLQGNWKKPVEITEIVPASGFQLDKIYITYTDVNGEYHERQELEGTKIGPFDGLPKSDVTVEVTFKPAMNALSIVYQFDDVSSVSATNNYKVNLAVDGINVNINRGGLTDKDTVAVAAADKDAAGNYNGIPTGKSVVISRNENGADERFNISKIWVLNNGKAIDTEYKYGQYYFTMPFVDDKAADYTDGVVIYVMFEHIADNKFNITSTGAVENGSAEHAATGVIGQPTNVTVKANEGYICSEPSATVTYTDIDGKAQTITVNANEAVPAAQLTFTIPALSSVDNSKAVTFSYKCSELPSYTLLGDGVTFVAEDGSEIKEAKAGTQVRIVPGAAPEGQDLNGVYMSLDGVNYVPVSGEVFEMPAANVAVMAKYGAAPAAISTVITDNGVTGTVKLYTGTVELGASVEKGSTVTVNAAAEGYDNGISKITYKIGEAEAKEIEANKGVYSFTVPADASGDVVVTVTFRANRHLIVNEKGDQVDKDEITFQRSSDSLDVIKVATGETIIVTPAEGKSFNHISLSYVDKDGNTVSADKDVDLKKVDGKWQFTIDPEKPIKEGENVTLKYSFN